MSATAATFASKSDAEQFAAAGKHKVFKVGEVYAVVISDHKISQPISYFIWSTEDD